MAIHTIKIVPQLIASRVRLDGTAAVRFAVNFRSKTAYIPANVWVKPEQWQHRKVVKHPQAAMYNNYLRAMQVKLEGAVLDIMRDGMQHGLDAYGVRDLLLENMSCSTGTEPTVREVLSEIMATARGEGTRAIYHSTITRLNDFTQKKIYFRHITPEFLDEFDGWLAKNGTPKKNARNIHLRNIRAAFNKALREKRTTAEYPFKFYSIRPEPTPAAAYNIEQLRMLWAADNLTPVEARVLDYFKLSFYLIGINIADLVDLVKIDRGRINYNRRKTGRRYSVAVLPEAARIIARHRGKKPGRLLDLGELYPTRHTLTLTVNKKLKAIAERLGLPYITWYTARYSWATIAANELDAPIETIALALGHTYGRAVTLGYISPDASKVDKLNRSMAELLK